MSDTRANDCAEQPHLHVGICQRAGYANGLADARASSADHTVTLEFDAVGYSPTLTFKCHAPEGADCRTLCPHGECEEGCVDSDAHEDDRVPTDYCNNVSWFENMDDVETCIDGQSTRVTVPVLIGWSRGIDGPDWRFAAPDGT